MPLICQTCFEVTGKDLEIIEIGKLCPKCGNHMVRVEGLEVMATRIKEPDEEATEPEAVEVEAEVEEAEIDPLEEYTVKELREKAKELEISGYSKMNKKKLIKKIIKKA